MTAKVAELTFAKAIGVGRVRTRHRLRTGAAGSAPPAADEPQPNGSTTTRPDAGPVGERRTPTARRLSLSVRPLTYRLERVHTLTGTDPTDPAHRYPADRGHRRPPARLADQTPVIHRPPRATA